jgi:integrase/recombinase XerD
MTLSECLLRFFGQYLTNIKGASNQTIKSYKDSLSIFLVFAAQYQSCKINSLEMEHLTPELILDFLDYLETERNNSANTRNQRLASLKSLAKMIRLIYPDYQKYADRLLYIPQKRTQQKLIGFISLEDFFKILDAVDLKKKEGARDYTILNLLYDSGARASEIVTLNINYFDKQEKSLSILGKGNRFRQMTLWPKTIELIELYLSKYRTMPKLLYSHRIFINQRGEEFTRHGINRICKKYLTLALPKKKREGLSPVHSFRHGCAMNLLASGASITDIKNRLGHDNIQSTMTYLRMELKNKREVHNKFMEYTQTILKHDAKIEELIDWEKKDEILNWLDSL